MENMFTDLMSIVIIHNMKTYPTVKPIDSWLSRVLLRLWYCTKLAQSYMPTAGQSMIMG